MKTQPDVSWLVRTSIRIGTAVGRWQRRLGARRDDALVEKWKAAWAEGSDACHAGIPEEKVPHRRSPRRDAWLAGWQWAQRSGLSQSRGASAAPAAAQSATAVDTGVEAGKPGEPEVQVRSQG